MMHRLYSGNIRSRRFAAWAVSESLERVLEIRTESFKLMGCYIFVINMNTCTTLSVLAYVFVIMKLYPTSHLGSSLKNRSSFL